MKRKRKKYKVVLFGELEADNITEAGLILCDKSLVAGCKVGGLLIKETKITGTEKE